MKNDLKQNLSRQTMLRTIQQDNADSPGKSIPHSTCLFLLFLFFGASSAFAQSSQQITTVGASNFTVPMGVVKVTVEAWGGGGAGGGINDNGNGNDVGGGGGAGGAYVKTNAVAVSQGTAIVVTVGDGGTGVSNADGNPGDPTTFASISPVTASGGLGGLRGTAADNTGNAVGATTGTRNGGGGGGATPLGTGAATATGAGGGGAGDTGNGQPGTSGTSGGGAGGTGSIAAKTGGTGANGRTSNGDGIAATTLSAGGSGAFDDNSARPGGNGFRGQVWVTWITPFQVGTVTPTGGLASAGAWFPSINTGVSIAVPIANDPDLTGGTIQILGSTGGAFGPLHSPIPIAAINTTQVVPLTKAEFESVSGYGVGKNIQITALLTGASGNQTQGFHSTTGTIVMPVGTTGTAFLTTAPSFTPPAGVHAVTVESWGGGAGGGSSGTVANDGGGGGGGGGYSRHVMTVTPLVNAGGVTVGTGGAGAPAGSATLAGNGADSQFPTVGPVTIARGGTRGLSGNPAGNGTGGAGGVAGTGSAATNTGGAGGTSDDNGGAGGGSSGGSGGNGVNGGNAVNPNAGAGGVAPTGGGNGGTGGLGGTGGFGFPGSGPGGGGGGSNDALTDVGGAGANGLVIIRYSLPPTISTIINNVNPIFTGALTQTVVVTFSEAMDPSITPVINISGPNWGAQTDIGTGFTVGNTVYTATFTHNGTSELNTTANTSVGLGSPPRSAAGIDLAVTATSSNFTVDTQVPVITVTKPTSTSFVGSATVSYSLSEAIAAVAGSRITWLGTAGADNGNSHVHQLTGGEITSGAHTDLLLADINPTLLDGSVYTVTFEGVDVNGNAATPVVRTNVTFDTSPPAAFLTGSVVTTGPAIVTNRWNTTNTGADVQVPVANDLTLPGGSIKIQARVAAGTFVDIGLAYSPIIGGDLGTTKTLNLTSGNITGISGYANGVTLEFRGVITDGAGNSTNGTQSANTLLVDLTIPTMTPVTPGNNAFVNTSTVTYTLSEAGAAVAGSKIFWDWISGSPDTDHTFNLTGGDLTAGPHSILTSTLVNGAVYNVSFDVVDLSGNASVTVTRTNITFDTTPPDVTLNQAGGQLDPTIASPINFTAVFSEPINPATFTAGDIVNSGTAAGPIIIGAPSGGPTSWNIAVTGMSSDGTVELTIAAGLVSDLAGNTNTIGTFTDNSVLFDIPPTVTVEQAIGQPDPTGLSPINFTAVFSKAIDPLSFNAGDVTVVTTTGGVAGPPTSGDNITWNIPIIGMSSSGTVTVSLGVGVVLDPAGFGNAASTSADNVVNFDLTPPSVTSLVIGPSPPLTGTGASNGTLASALPFRVTFNEDVTGVGTNDFIVTSISGAVVTSIGSVTGGPQVYDILVNVLSGTGQIRLDFISNGTVQDLAFNSTTAGFIPPGITGTYSVVLPPPVGHVTGLTATPGPNNFTINLNWSGTAAGANGYLVRVRGQLDNDAPGSFNPVVDGVVNSFDTNFADGNGNFYVSLASTSTSFTTLLSGKQYTFEVIPYAWNPNYPVDNISYLADGSQPSATATVTTATNGLLLTGTAIPPTTISSLQTTFGTDVNFSFRIQDDGASPALDNARTRFTQIFITAGPGNNVPNWSQVIAQAELTDITDNPSSPVFSTGISTSFISFAGLSTGSNGVGAVDDDETKEYHLRVRLRNPLTGGAWGTVDNQQFDFLLHVVNIVMLTTPSQPSRLIAGQSTFSGTPNRNVVDVQATQVTFNPAFGGVQPSPTASVLNNFAIQPVAKVTDANGNTDLNYTNTLFISSPAPTNYGGILPSSAGTYIFPPTGVQPTPIVYTDDGPGGANNGNITLTNGPVTGTSGNVTVSFSNTTVINTGPNAEPVNFSSLQTGALTIPAIPNNRVFDFNVQDDGGSGGDGAPTRITNIVINQGSGNTLLDWTEAFLQVAITNGSSIFFGSITPTSLSFNIPGLNPGDFGYVADNATNNYQILVRLRTSMLGSLATTSDGTNVSIDGMIAVYEVQTSGLTLHPVSSLVATSETENSGSGNNNIDVLSTQLRFTNGIGNPTLISKNISLQQAVPVVQATDINGNRDTNYNSTTILLTDNGSRSLANVPAANSLTSGLLTFPNNFQVTSVGGPATLTVSTTTVNAIGGTPSSAIAGAFIAESGQASTISAGAAPPATISSLVNAPAGVAVFNFDINDDPGGTPAGENDGASTLITGVRITQLLGDNTVPNWSQVILGARLTDGTNSMDANAITATDIRFGTAAPGPPIPTALGTLGNVPDNGTKNYTLRIWINPALTPALAQALDGQAFAFELLGTNVTTLTIANPTTFEAGTSLLTSPTQSTNSGAANVITVVATQLRFNHPSTPLSASLNSNISGINVEAIDANGNRDLNFTGAASTVRALTNQTAQTMINAPTVGTTQFSSGVLTFAPNFQYTTGVNGDIVTLNIRAGANSTCGTDYLTQGICGTSAVITLLSSFESSVVHDPNYLFAPTLDYVNHQEDVNIVNSATSQEIARLLLVDGDRLNFLYGAALLTTPYPNQDGLVNGDIDGAATNLTSITLRVTNPSNIRRIALYSGTTEIATDQTVNDLAGAPPRDFVFNGSPLLTAADNSQSPLSIRVSYWDDDTKVTDHDPIQVSVIAATVGVGSQFFNSPPNIAGVAGGYASVAIAPNSNKINVLATKLDFVTQPAAIAGINQPVVAGSVEAHDQFDVIDLDFTGVAAALNAGVPINGLFSFTLGELDISSMQYGNTGDGTITVSAGGLTSNMNNTVGGWPNVSIDCDPVDVLHVTASYNANGVITATNLVGGTANKVIFGFTFNAPDQISGQPKVDKFIISFSSNPSGVFESDIRIFEHQTAIGTPGAFGSATDITTLGFPAPVIAGNSLTVNLSSNPRDLSLFTYSYFVQADIDANASGSTPQMTLSLVDGGDGATTNDNIQVRPFGSPGAYDKASSTANVQGSTYTFAAIFPPTLISSYPAVAQANVSPSQTTLELTFSVPVYSLDQVVRLTEKLPGGASGPSVLLNLQGPDGIYSGGLGTAAQPIIFTIPGGFMQADKEYFVTIANGLFNGTGGTGIMDAANNLFPGISYSGTLYFRTSNNIPLKLLGVASSPPTGTVLPPVPSNPNITDLSATGATLNGIFDKPGKAFYLVLPTGSPAPIISGPINQIKNPLTYPGAPVTLAASGNFDVNSVNPVAQFGVISPNGGTFVPGSKDVWIYAESYSENNHVLTPIPNTAAYGSSATNFAAGTPGPTLQFNAPGLVTGNFVTRNLPNINICNNSWQILNAPIIITEGRNDLFNGGTAAQTMNIVLPAGFQFDVSLVGTTPKYGSIVLEGADFVTVPFSGQLGFLGNSILTIQYKNNGILTRDRIIISGLRVRATGTSTGPMFRLGGNALTGLIPDSSPMGTLSSADAATIDFDNSYSTTALGISQPGPVVTAIPDNTIPSAIQLTPYINPATGDFGPSSFSGQGVNINVLTLAAVTLDVPFNITITHTDNNGCISNNPVQYTVYNHNTAVNITNAGSPDQGPYCSTNTNFVPDQINPPPAVVTVRDVTYDNLPGYRMETLVAAIPASSATGIPSAPTGPIINSTSFGGAWKFLVYSLPNLVSTINIGGRDYRSYNFDERMILDANSFSYSQPPPVPPATLPPGGTVTAGTLPDPYSFFRQISGQNQTYYTGGSLGFVEFTGTYRSNTNPTVVIPRKQIVEFFLPAVPIVEVGQSNQPVQGTRIYCEAGGSIAINGYPAAFAGTSTGRFTVTDFGSGTIIYDTDPPSPGPPPPGVPITTPGFVDNGNGTATLDPAVLKNGYKRMRITYYFKQDNSPCATSASIDLQVTPNPITDFSFVSVNTPNTPTSTAFCEDRQVNFNAGLSTISAQTPQVDPTPFSIASYDWIFGEPGSGSNTANGLTSSHTYDLPTTYTITLNAKSNLGCPSVPITSLPITSSTVAEGMDKPIIVGGIPVVKFKMDGVAEGDSFRFNSNSTPTAIPTPTAPPPGNLIAGNTTVSVNDRIQRFDWDFGDGSPVLPRSGLPSDGTFNGNVKAYNDDVVEHIYTAVGPKTINLTVTSQIGCVNSLSLQTSYRSLVVLRKKSVTPAAAYFEQFETNDGDWQVWNTGNTANGISTTPISWTYLTLPPTNDATHEIEATSITGSKAWKTENLTGKYNGLERSALYSPTFDLSTLNRPMISFNSRTQLENGDGVVIQYSKDNLNIADPNKVWEVLGDVGEGVDWFTNQGIAASPGDQTENLGWSGLIPPGTGVTATPGGSTLGPPWDEPKHILDDVYIPGGKPSATKVVFRLAIASVATNPQVEGFAMDNFRVGERTRTILLESFANTSNVRANPTPTIPAGQSQEKWENSQVALFQQNSVGTEVIKINYHVSFPGRDPFNDDNPADPSSRALYYNISTTPVSRLDGDDGPNQLTIPNQPFSIWSTQQYDTRTLQLSQSEIAIRPTGASYTANGKISFMVDVIPVVNLDNSTIIHAAVLEQKTLFSSLPTPKQANVRSGETEFEFALKKMIPSAAGTRTRTHPNANSSGTLLAPAPTVPPAPPNPPIIYTFGPFEWVPDPQLFYAPTTGDLSIAVFLQNEMTREIYQAEIIRDLNDPQANLITGIEPIPSDLIAVYPNPASSDMTIALPGKLGQAASMLLFDQMGKSAIRTTIPAGQSQKTVSVQDLAAGLYILQIETGPGAITRKKVIVVHE